ncbi:MAG: RibD family protein [Chloroflexi bacterium]|nr:RibD family protein [Chloroflexota bacterium]
MSLAVPIDRLLADAARHRARFGRPLVTLTYAQSLDGSIAAFRGSRLAMSGPESLSLTHQLRAAHDAILVGVGTMLVDKPLLNVRLAEGEDPQPVVLDSRLRLPLSECLLRGRKSPIWVVTTERADAQKQKALEAIGARVLRVPSDARGRVGLGGLLERLAALQVNSLMVEGGARVITSFLSEHLVDLVVITIVPVIVGGLHAVEGLVSSDGREAIDFDGFPQIQEPKIHEFPKIQEMEVQRLGKDLVVWGSVA